MHPLKSILNLVKPTRVVFALLAVSIVLAPRTSSGAVVQLSPTNDARIGNAVSTDGTGSLLSVYNIGGNYQRTLVRFDLSTLGSNGAIAYAVFKLYASIDYGGSSGQPMELYRVAQPWIEAEVNWNNRTSGDSWAKAGGDDVGTTGLADQNAYVANNTAVAASGMELRWDVTPLVQQWYAGTHPNYGLLLLSYSGNGLTFPSRETGMNIPLLEVHAGNLPPIIIIQPTSRTNFVGTTAAFSVAAVGSPSLNYQWQRSSTNLPDGGDISGSTTSTLTLNNVSLPDGGNFQVVITNSYGAVTSVVATLTVTTNIVWTGAVGSDEWNNPTNWNAQRVPTASDHVVINSGSVMVPENAAFAVLDQMGDSISGSLTVASNSVMNWSGGTISGALTVTSNGVLNLTGSADKYLSGPLTNYGTVNWSGGVLHLPGSTGVRNFSLWDIQGDLTMQSDCCSLGSFENAGTLRKSAGSGTARIGWSDGSGWGFVNFTNTGIVEAQSGTLSFGGDYIETSSASLVISLGGSRPGSDYGHIHFSSPLTLNGTLTVTTRNGFRPNPGDTFNVLSYASATNDFTCYNGLDLGGGLFLAPHFGKTRLTLTATTYATNTALPSVFIARSLGGVRVLWNPGFPGWTLVSATNLTSPVWVPVSIPMSCDNQIVLPANAPQQYFRLKQGN